MQPDQLAAVLRIKREGKDGSREEAVGKRSWKKSMKREEERRDATRNTNTHRHLITVVAVATEPRESNLQLHNSSLLNISAHIS